MADLSTSRPPAFNLRSHPSTSHLLVPAQVYLSRSQDEHAEHACKFLATGAIVFSAFRILLVQRASSDSMPNLWETPGGACDDGDQTILHSVARELWEETGLVADLVGPMVGEGYTFKTRSSKVVRKLNFIVDVHGQDEVAILAVRLDPEEHQNFVWASEEEIRAHKVGDINIKFTTAEQEAVVLNAFAAKKASTRP